MWIAAFDIFKLVRDTVMQSLITHKLHVNNVKTLKKVHYTTLFMLLGYLDPVTLFIIVR